MAPPLGYFLTWTCYATWLHGDARGSIRQDRNTLDNDPVASNSALESHVQSRTAHPSVILDDDARHAVTHAIQDHCALRHWPLHALNVRTNHVHAVVTCPCETPPEQALIQFKAWSTRRLRESRLIAPNARVWTRHGSTKWLNTGENLARAIDYVQNQQ